jgi:hypothetical protein
LFPPYRVAEVKFDRGQVERSLRIPFDENAENVTEGDTFDVGSFLGNIPHIVGDTDRADRVGF